MSKNLEELKEKKKDYIDRDVPESGMDEEDAMNIGFFMNQALEVLEDFEKRLKRIEAELGIYTEEEIKNIKVGLTDPD